jgi:uncharacterized membrane protein YhaH (DUF805 family)
MGLLTRMHTELRASRFEQAQAHSLVQHCARVVLPLLCEIVDPRGRCNRKAYLYIAVTFLVLQFGAGVLLQAAGFDVSLDAALLWSAPIIWIGTAICVKRLHDVGLRGWWIPGAFAIWAVSVVVVTMIATGIAGEDAMKPGQPVFLAVLVIAMLPMFGALLWLHTAPSDPNENIFGPVPGKTGLSMPRRQVRVFGGFAAGFMLA